MKAKVVANLWATNRYAARPYSGCIFLFLASDSLESSTNPQLAWRELTTGEVKIHIIPGSHDAITRTGEMSLDEDALQTWAKQLTACIDESLLKTTSPR